MISYLDFLVHVPQQAGRWLVWNWSSFALGTRPIRPSRIILPSSISSISSSSSQSFIQSFIQSLIHSFIHSVSCPHPSHHIQRDTNIEGRSQNRVFFTVVADLHHAGYARLNLWHTIYSCAIIYLFYDLNVVIVGVCLLVGPGALLLAGLVLSSSAMKSITIEGHFLRKPQPSFFSGVFLRPSVNNSI